MFCLDAVIDCADSCCRRIGWRNGCMRMIGGIFNSSVCVYSHSSSSSSSSSSIRKRVLLNLRRPIRRSSLFPLDNPGGLAATFAGQFGPESGVVVFGRLTIVCRLFTLLVQFVVPALVNKTLIELTSGQEAPLLIRLHH